MPSSLERVNSSKYRRRANSSAACLDYKQLNDSRHWDINGKADKWVKKPRCYVASVRILTGKRGLAVVFKIVLFAIISLLYLYLTSCFAHADTMLSDFAESAP